ncbi:PAS two-component sensor histidine kinase [Alkalihalophilus pseudofirmus OF4]|uniref:histidine kinase n=1 Tax=Alkalihalophilus pseudofirmus (strain ATCC BAA-2126 / JCM 17055 / OF4) TaxID=398511 RepID=D3FV47_ALKPO|nr:PAS domain-containing sensor histidine kinase [Alkalihalophilus pseudofirmus]ADC50248.1 PAS two-component sensor histidine kinase [Alkalihalophilus pseudofirmus OF4]
MSYKKKMLLIYLVLGLVWIVFTDYLVLMLDLGTYLSIQKIKGIIFVVLTGFFIYYILGKREEVELLKNEKEKLTTLINSMVDFVNFKDGEGRWIESNEFGLKLFQLEDVDYRGKTDAELAKYTDFYHDALNYCMTSDEETWQAAKVTRCEEVIPLPNGDEKTFDTIKVPLFKPNKERKGLVVIGRDITERKLAEKQMKENELKYKSLFKYNPELVFMVDLNGTITDLNPKFEPLTAYNDDEAMGTPIFNYICEKDKTRIFEAFNAVIKEKRAKTNREVAICHKEGKKVIAHFAFVPIIIDNETTGIIGYATDITQILETEEKLKTTEKLAVIGELAAGIAHEIRNPLTSLKGFVQMFQSESKKENFIHTIMLDELDRINSIVSELLVLSRPQEITFSKKNINHSIKDVLTLLESEMNLHGVSVDFQTEHDPTLLDCEPNQFKQLFINLLKNAIEAEAKNICIHIKKQDDSIIVRIADNGQGISEERIKKLGEPFYSEKEKGTGLGLTVSFKIVEAHNGTIKYDSKVGTGTTVTMTFPTKED